MKIVELLATLPTNTVVEGTVDGCTMYVAQGSRRLFPVWTLPNGSLQREYDVTTVGMFQESFPKFSALETWEVSEKTWEDI